MPSRLSVEVGLSISVCILLSIRPRITTIIIINIIITIIITIDYLWRHILHSAHNGMMHQPTRELISARKLSQVVILWHDDPSTRSNQKSVLWLHCSSLLPVSPSLISLTVLWTLSTMFIYWEVVPLSVIRENAWFVDVHLTVDPKREKGSRSAHPGKRF